MPQRILRVTAASLSWQPLGGDGEPADPGAEVRCMIGWERVEE